MGLFGVFLTIQGHNIVSRILLKEIRLVDYYKRE